MRCPDPVIAERMIARIDEIRYGTDAEKLLRTIIAPFKSFRTQTHRE